MNNQEIENKRIRAHAMRDERVIRLYAEIDFNTREIQRVTAEAMEIGRKLLAEGK
jgi:hypothetical protein